MSTDTDPAPATLRRPYPRQRASQAAVVTRRAATLMTRDITRRLTQWHLEIAQLRGLVEYGRSSVSTDPEVCAEIDRLASEIVDQYAAFTEAVTQLPSDIASSSWITDVDRVVRRALQVLGTIRSSYASLQ